MDVNTPRLDSTKYRKATATNSTTQATSDMRKLNFITDQGSSRATTRSARRPATWAAGLLVLAGLADLADLADLVLPGSAAAAPARYRPRGIALNVLVRPSGSADPCSSDRPRWLAAVSDSCAGYGGTWDVAGSE